VHEYGMDSSGLVVGSCEHNNETSGSIKGRKFDQLSDRQFLTKDSVPWH